MLFSGMGVNIGIGFLYIWSIISKALVAEYGWTSAQASLPYTLHSISFVFAMLIFGPIQDGKGPKFCALMTGLFAGAGLLLSAFTRGPAAMAVGFGLVAGFGGGISNVCAAAPALKWFPREKSGLVSGIVISGVALASFIYSPLASLITARWGLYAALGCIGVISMTVICSMSLIMGNPPAGYDAAATFGIERGGDAAQETRQYSWRELLRERSFILLWLALGLGSSSALMTWGHAAAIAKFMAGWEGGMTLVILLAAFNFLGRLVVGGISDRFGKVRTLRCIFILQALNLACFSLYTSVPLLLFGIAVTGICYGGTLPTVAALVSGYGMKNFSANFSVLYTAWGVAGFLGPMSAAAVFDATGSYNTAFLIACGLVLAALLCAFLMREKRG